MNGVRLPNVSSSCSSSLVCRLASICGIQVHRDLQVIGILHHGHRRQASWDRFIVIDTLGRLWYIWSWRALGNASDLGAW